VNVTAFLCDYAEERLGKLYIMGAGWDVAIANTPMPIALAMTVQVPWDEANRPHELAIDLADQDGQPALINGDPVRIRGKFEAGRPAGVPPGTSLNMPLAPRIPQILLAAGTYTFNILIDDEAVLSLPFRMIEVKQ